MTRMDEQGHLSSAHTPLRLVTRFTSSEKRAALAHAIETGRVSEVTRIELLEDARLPQLARQSGALLLISGVLFFALDAVARLGRSVPPLPGADNALVLSLMLIGANLVAYVVMVPVHEAVHALVILVLGGRPRFGLKMPFAAWCTAPDQLFTPAGYTAIALAPLIVLTIVGIVVTWILPNLGAGILFGLAGNVSGAAGDLETVRLMRSHRHTDLVQDLETGFRLYSLDGTVD